MIILVGNKNNGIIYSGYPHAKKGEWDTLTLTIGAGKFCVGGNIFKKCYTPMKLSLTKIVTKS